MSAFVAAPPAPASPAASTVGPGGGFWPDVDVNAFRDAVRLGDTTLPHARLVFALEGAVARLMIELANWQARQVAAGSATLADVAPDLELSGEPLAVVLWTRAARWLAAAELADGHADLTATDQAMNRAADKRLIADDYRRMASTAQGQLLRLGAQDEADPGPSRAGGVMVDLV